MIKKISFISLTLLGLMFSQMPKECLAEMSDDIKQAQQNICNIIDINNLDAARSAADNLIADFSNNKDLPEEIYWTIRHCEWKDKFDEAKRLYQLLLQNYPDSPFTGTAKLGIARCDAMALVMSKNFDLAKTAFNNLSSDFAGNPDMPESLYMIGERFEWQWQFENEKSVFQLIINNCSGSPFASRAQIGIARANILSFIVAKDFIKFDKGLDKLFVNYANNPDLAQSAIIIGEWFYKDGLSQEKDGLKDEAKGNFERAVKVWDRVINELPDSNLIPEACCWAGDCYYKLNKFDESLQRFQKVINNYPEYKFAGHAQFEIGHNYLKMAESGLMAVSEAQTRTRLAYEQLLRKYPTCKDAPAARIWLYQHE